MLIRIFSLAAQYSCVFSIIRLDIDLFKEINTAYTHDVGDEVIKIVANILREHRRTHDVAARCGGDKFVMLLPEIDIGDAVAIAEQIRNDIESTNFNNCQCFTGVTASVGVAEYPASSLTGAELLARAEEALSQAKQHGRNRVCAAQFQPE
jgi:diguanylate cyclase (GGDEF)-like protein